MKKQFRFLSLLIAMFMILGSISFNSMSFADEKLDEEQNFETETFQESFGDEEESEYSIMGRGSQNGGKISVHKRVVDSNGNEVNADFGTETFEITLSADGQNDRTGIINKQNNTGQGVKFSKLANGVYTLTETNFNTEKYSSYYLESQGEGNAGFIDGNKITIEGNANINIWLVNKLKEEEPDPEPWKGAIRIHKDIEGQERPYEESFEFELIEVNDNVIGPLSTDEYGVVDFPGLNPGTYRVRELPKEGYTLVSPIGPTFVTIGPDEEGGDGNTWGAFFTNRKLSSEWNKGKIIVSKIKLGSKGKWGIRLPENPSGITFTLEGEGLDLTATTDNLGFAIFNNLPEGTYTLKEIVPAGYKSSLPDEGVQVIIEKGLFTAVKTISVVNKKLPKQAEWEGNIRVNKFIEGQETYYEELEDYFEFQLLQDGEVVAGPYLTDNFGKVDFTGLDPGTYEIQELPKEGYTQVSPEEPAFVTIGPDLEIEGNTWYKDFVNRKDDTPPREIIVQKVVDGLEDLSGFKFSLYRRSSDGEEFVAELITDSTGLLNFGQQEDSEYVLYEEFKEGFIMGIGEVGSENGHPFYHPEQTEEPIEIVNRRMPDIPNEGEIDVTKVVRDEDGATIFDNGIFTFILEKLVDGVWTHESTKRVIGNGNVKFTELEDGEYRVREINTPGYTLISSNNVLVTLYEENTGSAVFVNRKDGTPPPPPVDEPDPDPTPEPEPEPQPELPEDEEEIEEEPVPEAQPEPEPVPEPEAQPEPEPEVKDETIEVAEDPVPQAKPVATLPKTGTASPLMTSGFGTLLLAAGLFLRKRRR